MEYQFLNSSIEKENIILPNSDKINPYLLKNNQAEIKKGVDFISSDEKFLYIHGFLGTGKRQFINYICEFLSKDVIKLEYYCKQATVCDDILLAFNNTIENLSISKAINFNKKITTLNFKFQQQISSIKKPFLIILHSFDDVTEENADLIKETLSNILQEQNVKLIISTRGMKSNVIGDVEKDRKIFLKALSKNIFKEFLISNQITATDTTIEDFYKYTRGYYYYTALTIKIIQAMKINLSEFLQKFTQSEMKFDSFLGTIYINLVPTTIRNFFWFLRTIRHGLSLNALAIFELYDEFSLEYLKTNLMIFQADETIYVQDYFLQKIDISIPQKTQIKLHKYIIGIYERQLKAGLQDRVITISRQALRAEIEYHNKQINLIENGETEESTKKGEELTQIIQQETKNTIPAEKPIAEQIETAKILFSEKKYTEAIELFNSISEKDTIDLTSLVEIRLNLARLHKKINEYKKSEHFYDLVETYYKQHNELINLNYLYYEITDLYNEMYKNERAIETAKKIIYSVDTPQSLMVSACIKLGDIYSEINNTDEAYLYYQKALESLDENIPKEDLAHLYFKFALVNDDKEQPEQAFEFYNKCISLNDNNSYQALAYSNLGSCYFDNENFNDAEFCFKKAYELEKQANNYDGIYYNASYLAKIYLHLDINKVLIFLIEAKKSAEFINEDFYILESTIALGDYYYNNQESLSDALKEYFKALNLAQRISGEIEVSKIEKRINDMKLRMNQETFDSIEKKYAERN